METPRVIPLPAIEVSLSLLLPSKFVFIVADTLLEKEGDKPEFEKPSAKQV